MHPKTGGAKVIYESFFKPLLKKHQKEIEEFIEKVKSGAAEASKEAIAQAKKQAQELNTPENMMKAAQIAGQA